MNYRVSHPTKTLKGEITLTASKSESNRALILKALCKQHVEIENLAAAEDTRVLNEILQAVKANTSVDVQTYDVGAAGTTMRFLTAYLSTVEGTHLLTGSERMKQRPIKILVDALRDLGATIEYEGERGYPPLRITGKKLKGGEIEIDGSVSSQYISALLLVSTEFENELILKFKGEITSRPYINMTLRMMGEFLIPGEWKDNSIVVKKRDEYQLQSGLYSVEGDWSSASYWFELAAFAEGVDIKIKGLNRADLSLQGDAKIVEIFSRLGVHAEYSPQMYRLTKGVIKYEHFEQDFSDCPDIAQTVAVVLGALKIPATLTGLHTLKIKETNRTAALKNELAKVGVEVEIVSDDMIKIYPKELVQQSSPIATYEDHRMAMSFAPLALLQDSITIEHPEVVKKSYPAFWDDLKKPETGFVIDEV
jgi:3-phosphoshikimate 1-carboxyvinyltransferase